MIIFLKLICVQNDMFKIMTENKLWVICLCVFMDNLFRVSDVGKIVFIKLNCFH